MKFRRTLRHTQHLSYAQRLTLEQKQIISKTILTFRLALVGLVRGGSYQPQAACPQCGSSLTPLEIMRGFSKDPNDYTTECSSCRTRFEPKLVWQERIALAFYCPMQVLAMLHGLESKTPDEIREQDSAIYHSACIHYGSLRQAFQKIGIQYTRENVVDWKEKVQDFLGKLPDTVIAATVNMPVKTVRNLRKSLGITAFKHRDVIEMAAVQEEDEYDQETKRCRASEEAHRTCKA